MSRKILPEAWCPSGIDDLEPNAWEALRHTGSACVVAGPGAGKTEFLAQRAVYLLETGLCPHPYQILAISFKADAAKNLAERVKKRCPPELAQRFVSLTFDAFTKSLVDRFFEAIPTHWQPTWPYSIVFPSRKEIQGFLAQTLCAAPKEWQSGIVGLSPQTFEAHHVGHYHLDSAMRPQPNSPIHFAIQQWWAYMLDIQPSKLSFTCINRLAELLLRSTPHLKKALRATYPFIFVDEFQDTTYAQYDFLLSAFYAQYDIRLSALSSPKISITAVGDHKQRIMGWAGARNDAFEQFETDFGARRFQLLYNFRSSPELVRVQNVVARALDAGFIAAQSQAPSQLTQEVVQIWNCTTQIREAAYLSTWLAQDMQSRGKTAKDYAILVRQSADDFEAALANAFASKGLRIRNESRFLGEVSLQDLLADEMLTTALALLRLGVGSRDPEAWDRASTALRLMRGVDIQDEVRTYQTERELNAFLKQLRSHMQGGTPSDSASKVLADLIFTLLDATAITRAFAQYARNDMYELIQNGFRLYLAECAQGATNWEECLDKLQGVGQISLMTVHKSKGLEYDTVAFVGLDDSSWWSHTPENPEGIATFFVALSRAKQRAIFMFCQARGQRERVADLYQLLTNAGVQETMVG